MRLARCGAISKKPPEETRKVKAQVLCTREKQASNCKWSFIQSLCLSHEPANQTSGRHGISFGEVENAHSASRKLPLTAGEKSRKSNDGSSLQSRNTKLETHIQWGVYEKSAWKEIMKLNSIFISSFRHPSSYVVGQVRKVGTRSRVAYKKRGLLSTSAGQTKCFN